MKKLILAALLTAATQSLFAQSIKLGIKGGLNESTTYRGDVAPGNSNSYRAGFNAGVFADFEYNKWSIEPGLFYTVKGSDYKSVFMANTVSDGLQNATMRASQTFNYLELPVNILYNVSVKPGKLFFGAGPYLGYFLSGKSKFKTTIGSAAGSDYQLNLDIGSGGDFKRTDLGVNALAGIKLKSGLLCSIGYGYGFTNILNNTSGGTLKNRVMNISVGYAFL